MGKNCPTLRNQGDQRVWIFEVVLFELKPRNLHAHLQPVADFKQIFVLEAVFTQVKLRNRILAIFEPGKDVIKTSFGHKGVERKLDLLLLRNISDNLANLLAEQRILVLQREDLLLEHFSCLGLGPSVRHKLP